MEKRKITFGTYDTAVDGLWTLAAWSLSSAQHVTNYVAVPGRDGSLDLSTAITDGEPRYNDRTLTATFESSEGTRLERDGRINVMTNWLDGWRMNIELPDDPDHYITGRLHIQKDYNDPAHAAVTVTAVCDPWRYNKQETLLQLQAGETTETAILPNYGRRTAVPVLTIEGEAANVLLAIDGASWALGPGTYQLPDLIVPQGGRIITYSGTGTLSFAYREASL